MSRRYENPTNLFNPSSKPAGAKQESISTVFLERGYALHVKGELTQAKKIYDYVLELQSNNFEALHLSGVIALQLNNLPLAVELFSKAIEVNPNNAEVRNNYGLAMHGLTRMLEAVSSFDKAIEIKPDFAQAHYNRGNSLKELTQILEAVSSFDKAISLKPDYAVAYNNRGLALEELNRIDEALASFDKAIDIKPDYADAYSNRGNAFQKLNHVDEALANYDKAISIKPDYAVAYYNRGNAFQKLNRVDEALANFDRAIEIKPDYADALWNKSISLLLQGDFKRGWELYEWRWEKSRALKRRAYSQPLWLGEEKITGKTILLYSEQGLGDTIQFCRYVTLIKKLGAKVILEVPQALLGLLSELEGIDELVETEKALPVFDYHCPLMSLPLAFKTDLTNIPSPHPYLAASPKKCEEWAQRLGVKGRLRVGLVWSGSTVHLNDHNRSLPFQQFLLNLPQGYDYVSLQKEVRQVDKFVLESSGIRYYGDELKDFTETAALCELMDLVISVDTSVAHLASAIGKKTWILLPYVPDWRWLLDRDDSPWYGSVRLYRQDQDRQWQSVLERVFSDLTVFSLNKNCDN